MVRIIAHRGSSHTLPENSLAAFQYALASGADSLEVDLRCSADGVIYCLHDYHLRRLTGYSGYVSQTQSRQINRLRLTGNEPILRFDHFLEETDGKAEIILDIKSAGVEADILRQIGRHTERDDIIFSSFNSRILSRIKTLRPQAQTALILGPLRNLKIKLDIGSYVAHRLTRLGCAAAHLSSKIAGERVVKRIRNSGFDVAVWTVDDPSTAELLVRRGVDGIITNVPEQLVKVRHRLEGTG